ncbi:hypothetical protein ACFY5D_20020 [Paeniglutamicibacter sp. NPDC012692]|uniref:hypothetical protein n=1 Tax=Paeniglutamicibacter sp. NPDC012692 TaxID=3364388 RepID=UPI0036BDC803
MPYPMRSTVGAAVLAGALVFSGTVANAQPVPADESVASAPVEQGTPDAGETTPVLDQGDAPLQPTTPVEEASGNGGSAGAGTEAPDAGTPGGEPADGPADTEGETGATDPATEEVPADTEPAPAEGPAGAPVDATVDAPAGRLPAAGQPAPLTGAEAPAGQVAPPAAKPATAEKVSAEAKAAPAPLPGAGTITIPEGAAEWTTEQWNEWAFNGEGGKWLETNEKPLKEAMESEDFAAFADSVIPFLIEGDPYALQAYLDSTYPDDAVLAQLMLGVLIGQLMEEGVLDENGNFIGELVPETEEPSEEPAEETDEEPVIEPVVNVTKPKASTTKPVEVFTPVKVPARGLAETGADGIGLLAGTGGGLLVLGVGALVLRRRKQA